MMEYFLDKNKVQEFLTTEILSTGEKVNLTKLNFPVLEQIKYNSDISVYIQDADTSEILALNKTALRFNGIESPAVFEHKDAFFMERLRQEQHNNKDIRFAHKVTNEFQDVLSKGVMQLYGSNFSVDENGFCVVRPTIRIPLYDASEKIKVVFVTFFEFTRREHIENLYNRYKLIYKNDMKKGNRLFMEYLGLPVKELFLTTRQIETLIALAKNRTNVGAARELGLSEGTLASYIHEIKNRLHNQNLDNILLYFTTWDKRKF